MNKPDSCVICERSPGPCELNRYGEFYTRDLDSPIDVLGPLEECDLCGLWVCPECNEESDCCFQHEEDHEKDPNWAPKGWMRESPGGVWTLRT